MLVAHRASLVTDEQVAWLNDPEVVKYSEQRHRKHTLESQHEYLNTFPSDSHIWLIQTMVNDPAPLRSRSLKYVGTITAYIDRPNKIANMGILIGEKKARGIGLGTEAWGLVMGYLKSIGVRKIECGCMAVNVEMVRLAIKCGMMTDGVRPWHFMLDDETTPLPVVYYAKYHS